MENLTNYTDFKVKSMATNYGNLTSIKPKYFLSTTVQNIEWNNKTVIATQIYNKDETYNIVYSIIDFEGNVLSSYLENAGILPELFKNPSNEIYVSLTIYHPDKDLDISVPLIERIAIEKQKPTKEFAGKYIGSINQSVIFHDVDIFSDKKQDKILNIEFKNGKIHKKRIIKIDFPKDNTMFIHNNEIHLFENGLHRQIDEFGKELKRRKVKLGKYWCRALLMLSFEGHSCFISDKNGKITLVIIDEDGKCKAKDLIDIGDEIYNMFEPVKIGKGLFVINYNTGYSNGWFTLKDDKLIEFYYDKGGLGYKNLMTNEIIEIGSNDLIINGINKTVENGYAIIFSTNAKDPSKNTEVFILNRTIE
jgi:hypothetical protein